MNNKRFSFRRLLVVLAAMAFVMPFMATSCQPKESVRFNASYSPSLSVDTITFEAWSLGKLVKQNSVAFYPSPSDGQDNQSQELPIYIYHGVRGVPTEVVFLALTTEYDSVRFTRSSDGLLPLPTATLKTRRMRNATSSRAKHGNATPKAKS